MSATPAPSRVFRPRKGRLVPLLVAAAALIICTVVAVGLGRNGSWALADQVALVAVGAAIAALMWRYASIRATATDAGLRIRNLLTTRDVAWGDIVDLRFPDGDPWASAELVDTDVVAVMGIQRVDGQAGRDDFAELVLLWRRHGGAGADRGSSHGAA